jgi:protein involved in sex pheromone biosynthesis
MKKLIFFSLAAVLVLSACGAKNNKTNEENNMNKNEEQAVSVRTLDGQEDLTLIYDQAILHTNLGDIV